MQFQNRVISEHRNENMEFISSSETEVSEIRFVSRAWTNGLCTRSLQLDRSSYMYAFTSQCSPATTARHYWL